MDQIAVDPKSGMDEKKKMMEMLRRFEDAQAGDEGALAELDGAENESEDELERALADIDLGASTTDYPGLGAEKGYMADRQTISIRTACSTCFPRSTVMPSWQPYGILNRKKRRTCSTRQ